MANRVENAYDPKPVLIDPDDAAFAERVIRRAADRAYMSTQSNVLIDLADRLQAARQKNNSHD